MRLLVVDDDPRYRTLIRVLLEGTGFDIVEADSGVGALRTMREVGADAVLCDLFMPDLDGLELIRYLRGSSPNVGIVAMSGGEFDGALDLLAVARRLGAVETLHKPFHRERLLAATCALQSSEAG